MAIMILNWKDKLYDIIKDVPIKYIISIEKEKIIKFIKRIRRII